MELCSHCNAHLEPGMRFCPVCGQRLADAGAEPVAESEAEQARARRWHRGSRVVLMFLGGVLLLGAVFIAATVYFIRHTTIVTSSRSGGRVESPFGVVTASNDPAKLAHTLGLNIYPGAVGEHGAQAELAHSMLISLTFRAPRATPREVIHFYHIRYPDAAVKQQGNQITLVQVGLRDTMTIKASPLPAGATEIAVSDIAH